MQARMIVAICGPSNAGKSQLAKAVAVMLGPGAASRVPTDYFFDPRAANELLAAFLRRPLAYDWTLLARTLAGPDGAAVTTPDAQFEDFTRRADDGGLPFTLCPVMIVDAMIPYPAADLLVRLDVPDEIRRERIVARDRRWGARVAANWMHLEATWMEAQRMMRVPDLTLDGTLPLEMSARTIVDAIDANRRRTQ